MQANMKNTAKEESKFEQNKAALKEMVADMDPKEVVDLIIGMQGQQYREPLINRVLYCLRFKRADAEKRGLIKWSLGRVVGIGKSRIKATCKRCNAI